MSASDDEERPDSGTSAVSTGTMAMIASPIEDKAMEAALRAQRLHDEEERGISPQKDGDTVLAVEFHLSNMAENERESEGVLKAALGQENAADGKNGGDPECDREIAAKQEHATNEGADKTYMETCPSEEVTIQVDCEQPHEKQDDRKIVERAISESAVLEVQREQLENEMMEAEDLRALEYEEDDEDSSTSSAVNENISKLEKLRRAFAEIDNVVSTLDNSDMGDYDPDDDNSALIELWKDLKEQLDKAEEVERQRIANEIEQAKIEHRRRIAQEKYERERSKSKVYDYHVNKDAMVAPRLEIVSPPKRTVHHRAPIPIRTSQDARVASREGRMLVSRGCLKEAQRLQERVALHRSRKWRRKHKKDRHHQKHKPRVADSLSELAKTLELEGKSKRAAWLHSRAAQLRNETDVLKTIKGQHKQRMSYNSLIQMKLGDGERDDAVDLLQRQLSLTMRTLNNVQQRERKVLRARETHWKFMAEQSEQRNIQRKNGTYVNRAFHDEDGDGRPDTDRFC